MRVVIDAVGIRGHGGAAVLCELLRWLPIVRPQWRWHVFLLERHLREFDDPPATEQVTIEHTRSGDGGMSRLFWVNRLLPKRLQTVKANVLFSFANIAPARSRIPQVVFCHQLNAFFSDGLPTQAVLKRVRMLFMRHQILRGARASQGMIVQTEAMRRRILELTPRLEGQVHVIPSGYRTASPSPAIRSDKKEMIDRAKQPRLIYVSHPSEHKNHLVLIRAMPNILQSFPSASLLLTLEHHDAPNRRYQRFIREIEKRAKDHGVGDRIVWLGQLNHEEVGFALRQSDLMVFPSLAESFGLGLVESMAAGCPIAAADISYAHDVCGGAAAYFNPCEPEDIAKAVSTILSDNTRLQKIKAAGERQKSRYSYQIIAGQIAEVLQATAV
jgi:glycosyltransferase involved in cell wall biosynthesis